MKTRICYVCRGASVHDVVRLRALAESGRYELHLIAHGAKPPEMPGVTMHALPRGKLGLVLAPVLVPLLIRRLDPAIVHGNYLATGGFLSALSLKHPLLQTAMGSDVLVAPRQRLMYRLMVKFALCRAEAIWAPSENVADALVALGCPRKKIHVFSLGVDLDLFYRRKDTGVLRESLGFSEEAPVVVCTRNHEDVYGVEYLVDAIPAILRARPEAKFLLVGSGSLSPTLARRAKGLGVASSVVFVGRVPHERLPDYLSIADLYVCPSLSDAISISLLEAMACGLPVVTTDVPGKLERVQDGVNGYVVPKRDSVALTDAVCRMLSSPQKRSLFGRRNAAVVQGESYQKGIEQLEHLYGLLLRRSVQQAVDVKDE